MKRKPCCECEILTLQTVELKVIGENEEVLGTRHVPMCAPCALRAMEQLMPVATDVMVEYESGNIVQLHKEAK